MKYDYNEEQVVLDDTEIEEIVDEIVGGYPFDLFTNFEDYARDRINEAVEENDGTEDDYFEAMEDLEVLTIVITENVREKILEQIETIVDNLNSAVYELESY